MADYKFIRNMKEIEQYKKVLLETESDNPTLIDYWARRAVISEALMGSAYLKRRIKDLWSNRKDHDKNYRIRKALFFIKELKCICNAQNLGHRIPELSDKSSYSKRTDGSLTIESKEELDDDKV